MTIRLIGPLLCGGLLLIATSGFADPLQIKNIPTGPGDDIKAGAHGNIGSGIGRDRLAKKPKGVISQNPRQGSRAATVAEKGNCEPGRKCVPRMGTKK